MRARVWGTALCLLVMGAGEGTSQAQPSSADQAVAQGLFDAARALLAQKRYAEACPKLEESQRLDPGLGTEYHLADCYEHVGRMASAWAAFLDVAAKSVGQPERERVARARARALEGRIPRLAIVIPPRTARVSGLEVKRDGTPVGPAQFDTPLPVDPGTHVVSVRARGNNWETTVGVQSGPAVRVMVPDLVPANGNDPAGTAPGAAGPAGERTPSHAAPVRHAAFDRRSLGWIVAGVGVLGVGVGAVAGIRSLSKSAEADEECISVNVCSPAGREARQQASTAGNVSAVALVLGGAALAAGVVLVLTTPREPAQARGPGFHVRQIAAGPFGVSVQGSF